MKRDIIERSGLIILSWGYVLNPHTPLSFKGWERVDEMYFAKYLHKQRNINVPYTDTFKAMNLAERGFYTTLIALSQEKGYTEISMSKLSEFLGCSREKLQYTSKALQQKGCLLLVRRRGYRSIFVPLIDNELVFEIKHDSIIKQINQFFPDFFDSKPKNEDENDEDVPF